MSEAQRNECPNKRVVMLFRNLFVKEREIFLTHTMGDWCKPGTTYIMDGAIYVVTTVKRVSNTALADGGSAPCWSVRGKQLKT